MNRKIVFFTLIVIIGYCLEVAAYSKIENEKITKLLKKAALLEKQKEYSNAIEVYNKALQIASEKKLIDDASYIYKKIGLIYYRQKDYKESKKFYKKSIFKNKDSKNAADSYFNLSLIYRKEKTRDSLLWALNNSLAIYKNLEDDKDKFSTYSKAGILFKQNGQYDNAISYLLLAYDGYTKIGGLSKKATIAGNIGDIQRLQGNFDIAKIYYLQHLELQLHDYDTLKVSFAYNNMANLFYQIKHYDSAVVYYQKALKLQRLLVNVKNTGKTLSNLGISSFKKGDLKEAKKYYSEALTLKKIAKDSNAVVQTLGEIALIEIRSKKLPLGLNYLIEADIYISSITEKKVLLRNYEVNFEYFKIIGDYKKAYWYQNKYLALYKQIFNTEQTKTIQALQEQFESQLKESKISDLTQINEQKNAAIEIQKGRIQNRNLLLLLSGITIVLLAITFLFFRQRHKVKLQQQEYKNLEAVLQGQELLKHNIGKDLHDIILTSYDAIRLKILALSKAKDSEATKQSIVKDIQNINREVRLISHRLSPLGDKIKKTTLTEIIVSGLSEFHHYRDIFLDVQLPLPNVLNEMTLNAKTNFYGILLEILNNVDKHSKATIVFIKHSELENRDLRFEFCDNGIGMSEKQIKGIGLLNIKQRTTLLGGTYSIYSNKKGTCITIEFPVKQNLL